jgi:hypothetical protein
MKPIVPISPVPNTMIKSLLFLAGFAIASNAGAQSNGTPRDHQLRMLEHQRKVLLQMVDSMPERLYLDKVTPTQRHFAGQIHHAAGAVALIARQTMSGPAVTLPDTTAFASRANLRNFVMQSYDYATALIRTQTDASRSEEGDLFGSKMPKWQIWDELHMHTVWTAGQIVGNFRKHNMAPPAFTFF